MSTPVTKPVANLTKKGYSQICDYISGNASPEHAQMLLDLMTEAMKNTIGFDPEAKVSKEVREQKYNRLREKFGKLSVPDQYEKYGKKHYEKKKDMFPDVPTTLIKNNNICDLQKMFTVKSH